MIYALIGHRGVGKTSLLKRIQKYRPDAYIFCLDERIEEYHGPIQKIFQEKGEAEFRKIEKQVFNNLYEMMAPGSEDVYISVGAGYSEELPKNVRKIWVRREVDMSKMLFLNRPTLNSNKSLLNMPKDIFLQREKNYAHMADEELVMPEGDYGTLPEEELFFSRTIKNCGGVLTILPWHVEKPHFVWWCKVRDAWGLQAFELRNDLLTGEQIQKIMNMNLRTPLLFSFRQIRNLDVEMGLAQKCKLIDWDLSLVEAPAIIKEKCFFSYHSDEETFSADLQKMKANKSSMKWSPLISSFSDLEAGHDWMMENPKKRAFLPRSIDGRWSWYRRLMKNKMMINFFREGKGSAADQPTLLEWLAMEPWFERHAAILGAPIKHSWTPLYHRSFFRDLKMNIFPIPLFGENANKTTLGFLRRLGFVAFAVTSPLKSWAAQLVEEEFSVNTLVWSPAKRAWLGFSTDMIGFEQQMVKISLNLQKLDTAIWGAGSMAEAILEKYPKAIVFSARTGEPLMPVPREWTPQVVIWASGDTGEDLLPVKYPHWNPIWIVDLNYRQDSPAISFAHKWGARYVSGADMFFGQAREQQKIWKRELKK